MAVNNSKSGPPDRPFPQLLQQSEKILLHTIHAHLISYCPTMDLIAIVSSEENLDVYRINGQRAFGLKRKSEDVHVMTVCWQWNGAAIGVCWSDGAVDVVAVETGKVVHPDIKLSEVSGEIGDDAGKRVRCLGWGMNFIDVEGVKRRVGASRSKVSKRHSADRKDAESKSQAISPIAAKTAAKKTVIDFDDDVPTTEDWDAFRDDTTLEDFLQRQPDFETLDIAPDLPDQLAMMDTESLLPKLPPIPLPPANPFMMRAAQADAGAFSTQAQVDSLLHTHHLRDHNSVDMFIRCTEKGSVHPSIYDSMETVDIRLPEAWGVQSTPLAHTSHPYACTHGLLMEIKTSEDEEKHIAYVPLTLGFIPSAGIYLHLIASKTAQLQNLLSYLTNTLARIRSYFAHSQDLPDKFMRNISETLSDSDQGGLVENLYHLACTGHCSPAIHEWLVDELAEQGHKRWDNAISSNLAVVIQLLHENLLPAIDRCSIIISRLRGLAAYHDRDWIFSGPLSDFTSLLEQLKSLRLLGHTTLLYAADEKRQFTCFSKWLRYSIDFEATEPESTSRTEMEAKDPDVPIPSVLSYIEHNMAQSDLTPYLKSSKEVDGGDASYEETVKAIEQRREGVAHREDTLCLERVLVGIGESVGGLLKQVSRWQRENIGMDCGVVLQKGEVGDELDMRMVYEIHTPWKQSLASMIPHKIILLTPSFQKPTSAAEPTISTYIALTPASASPSSPTLQIHRLTHATHLTTPSSPLTAYATTTISVPGYRVLDAKFADDTDLLILLKPSAPTTDTNEETPPSILLSIPYTTASTSSSFPPHASPSLLRILFSESPNSPPLLPSTSTTSSSAPQSSTLTLSPPDIESLTKHVFTPRFSPLKIVVNGRKGRRVLCVVGEDRRHVSVLDLDYREGDERLDDDDDDSDEGIEGDGDVVMGGV
ncbi:unnamed protein product [Periconia digitata]|uniref:Anaphase-promoting complex subunit 4 n=1 Tax=Periconia digitata TaxID=1303443 RepID=A0A9W4UK54_9PLEO|nr:unnamed protein product [Periconia digitata]